MVLDDSEHPELKCDIDVYNVPFGIPIPHNSNEFTKPIVLNKNLDSECLKKYDKESDLHKLLVTLKDVSYDYQYLDHPADVILLGQGKSIKEALESISISLFNYISDLSYVEPKHLKTIEVTGKGLIKLLYHLLDECLYLYSGDYFIAKYVLIEDLNSTCTNSDNYFENYEFKIKAIALGDYYDKNIHKCGTEIKAITMHHLSIKLWIEDQVYEFKNDMESNKADFLKHLKNLRVTKCKAFALVDI
ncbi:uncharacterized protein TA02705 [Theileria annulata]|uniref:Archease domain-containing protein n=1 Tax=Theileria annulata TaxID=5874 RepID=Q4UD44_THEAN|nr:uncharacterized protein TA02705 [Theileria annulata]CAI75257.1 hypothetical protein, conserved [Theileria annulata]|eukprot:XP_954733.1 hypothetical protein, conserved [Theileria annulata]